MRSLLIFMLSLVAAAYSQDFESLGNLNFGPNLRHRANLEAPLVWGAGIPRAEHVFLFDWLEPVDGEKYGYPLGKDPMFLHFGAGTLLSPLYVEGRIDLGLQLLPHVEVRFRYSNMLYLASNVEMAMEGKTAEEDMSKTWRADYIFDNMYQHNAMDQIQSFGFLFDVDLSGSHHRAGIQVRHTLVDVSTSFEGRSIDYTSGIPVYSRDLIFETRGWLSVPVTRRYAVASEVEYWSTGYIKDLIGNFTKEPQSQFKAKLGGSIDVRHGSHPWRLLFLPGIWFRDSDSFEGSLAEQFFVEVSFQQEWGLFKPEK